MRVLVTGSSGRLGTAIVATLRPRHEVVGLDLSDGPMTTVRGSIEDRELVQRVTRGIDAVVHTAALHAPHVGRYSRGEFVDANVIGTLNLLEAGVASAMQRFVYTSTTSLYGSALVPTDRAVWVTEDLCPHPRDIYDATKLAAEELCRDFARGGLPTVRLRVARYFSESPEQTAVHRLSRAVDIRDAAAAHALAVEWVGTSGTFNVAARSPFDESDLEELLTDAAAVIRRRVPWAEAAFASRGWTLPRRIERVYVTAKAQAELGFRPVHNIESLLGETGCRREASAR